MKKLSFLFFVLVFISSCGGNGFDAEAEKNKIFDVHDEVMPKMGELMNLKRKVMEKAGEMESEQTNELRDLAKELDDASESMMSWMRDWSKNSAEYLNMKNGAEEQKAYLANEMKKVEEVKKSINDALAKAKAALK